MLKKLKEKLQESDLYFGAWAGSAAFLSYFCMYMYRKPFSAGAFQDIDWFGADYKVIIVISQIIGYALSKFIGIKVISELKGERRISLFLILIAVALMALFGFSRANPKWGPLFLFFNGLPLGMIWGIVFTYCEGRRITEVLTVFLSANFILSSGLAKTFGAILLASGVSEFSMPFYIGLMTLPILLFSLWMLSIIPPPSEEEMHSKSERKPMSGSSRLAFYKEYKIYIYLFVVVYIVLTCLRDIRDNFALEIWNDLGITGEPAIFTKSELPITIVVLLAIGLVYRIKSNKKAFQFGLVLSSFGVIILLLTSILFSIEYLSPFLWMTISGVGLFIPYILMNGIIFDRFIATFRILANVGFLMYIVDAFGYLASVSILIIRNFFDIEMNWLDFYLYLIYGGGVVMLVLFLAILFKHKKSSASMQSF